MWLLVGLGNPGDQFCDTRHNLGFRLIDRLAEQANIKVTKLAAQALVGRGRWLGQEVILAKPQTYMNLSGQSVKGLVRCYGVELDKTVVIHDDLDIALGLGKLTAGGGSGGHKGVGSIIDVLGSADFVRLKLGIGRPREPYLDAADYVLKPFGPEEVELVDRMLERAEEALEVLLSRGLQAAQNRFNRVAPVAGS